LFVDAVLGLTSGQIIYEVEVSMANEQFAFIEKSRILSIGEVASCD
jgi:hypothetical protein